MSKLNRFFGAALSITAIVASLAVARAETPAPRAALPGLSTMLPGGQPRLEDPAEALAASQYLADRNGVLDPAKATDALFAARAAAAKVRVASGALGKSWKELGPKPYYSEDPNYADPYGGTNNLGWDIVSGRVTALAVDPSDATGKTVFVGTAAGGVWVTRDAGAKWTPIWDSKETLAIGAIAFDEKRSSAIYVGTGEGNLGGGTMFRGVGMYRSLDKGKTFTRSAKNIKANVISSIAARNGIVYVASDNGLWRSTDSGASYTDVKLPTNEAGTGPQKGLFGTVVTDVKIHPKRSSEVTAAVGWPRGKLWTPGNGLYRSSRSGAPGSWTRMNVDGLKAGSKTDDAIGRISLAYATGAGQNNDVLWAIVQDPGLLNNVLRKNVVEGTNISKPPAGMATVLNGVYRSEDDGATWELKGTPETFTAAPGTGIAAFLPLYQAGVQTWYNQWILVHPQDENKVFVGMEEIYQTIANTTGEGPAAWTTIGRYWNSCTSFVNLACHKTPAGDVAVPGPYAGRTTHPDQHAAAFALNGGRLYAGNDGGVFVQDSASGNYTNEAWRTANATLGTTQPYYATMAEDGTVYAGFQDNGTSKITPSGYGVMVYGGDGGDVAVEPDNSDHAWEEYVFGAIAKTSDGGKTWLNVAPELTSAQFIAPFEMDPKNKNHLVLGANEIVETTKGIDTLCPSEFVVSGTYPPPEAGTCDWLVSFTLGQNLTATPPVNYSTTAIDIQAGVIYAGYCGTCGLVSTDKSSDGKVRNGLATNRFPGCKPAAGSSACWHHADAHGLPNRFISDVTIDPRNPEVVYVTLGGYSRRWLPPTSKTRGIGKGHVFVSRDAGESFKDVSANLPDEPAESIEVKGDRLFVATHSGVYTAARPGAAWERVGRNLPNAPAMDVNLNPQGTTLLVATHGRGVWSYDLRGLSSGRAAKSSAPVARTQVGGMSVAAPPSVATQEYKVTAVTSKRQESSLPLGWVAVAAGLAAARGARQRIRRVPRRVAIM